MVTLIILNVTTELWLASETCYSIALALWEVMLRYISYSGPSVLGKSGIVKLSKNWLMANELFRGLGTCRKMAKA